MEVDCGVYTGPKEIDVTWEKGGDVIGSDSTQRYVLGR